MRDASMASDVTANPEESLSIILAAYREGQNLSILLPGLTTAVQTLAAVSEPWWSKRLRREPGADIGCFLNPMLLMLAGVPMAPSFRTRIANRRAARSQRHTRTPAREQDIGGSPP